MPIGNIVIEEEHGDGDDEDISPVATHEVHHLAHLKRIGSKKEHVYRPLGPSAIPRRGVEIAEKFDGDAVAIPARSVVGESWGRRSRSTAPLPAIASPKSAFEPRPFLSPDSNTAVCNIIFRKVGSRAILITLAGTPLCFPRAEARRGERHRPS